MLDRYERKIDYLRISLTDRCNYRCKYCMPEGLSCKKNHEDMLTLEEINEISKIFVKKGIKKIRLTGGEPLVRKNVETLIKMLAEIDGLEDLAMTTNGYFLKEKAEILWKNGLKRLNISLDSLDFQKYKMMSQGGDLEKVLEAIKYAKNFGYAIKINTVLIKGFNDGEIYDLIKFSKENDLQLRFIELMPIGETADFSKEKFISSDEIIKKLNLMPIENSDKNSPTSLYKVPDFDFTLGLIEPLSHKFCKACNRLRLTSDGKIRPCLHSDLQIDLKKAIRENKDIEKLIDEALMKKPQRHHLENEIIKESMYRIGG